MFSLLTPMPGLPWYLLPVWPLIFWRIQRLKAWFRDVGGPDSEMLWGIAWNGRVVIVQLSDDLSGPHPGIFRAPVSSKAEPQSLRGDEDPLSPHRPLFPAEAGTHRRTQAGLLPHWVPASAGKSGRLE